MRWRLITAAALTCAAAAAIALGVLHAPLFSHWLQVHTGTVNEPGPYYGFWSGFGSDLEEFGILGAIGAGIYQLVKKYNCHEPGCWRVGQHPAAGGQFLLCYRHHPDYQGKKPTHELIERLHREHLERQAAMQSKLHQAQQHRTAKPATANDVHRPQPSAQRLGSVPISRPEPARWRSRISSSSALAPFHIRCHPLAWHLGQVIAGRIRVVCTRHATSASRLTGSYRDSMSMSWAAVSPGRDVSRHAP
jgi:hypothetical protein